MLKELLRKTKRNVWNAYAKEVLTGSRRNHGGTARIPEETQGMLKGSLREFKNIQGIIKVSMRNV